MKRYVLLRFGAVPAAVVGNGMARHPLLLAKSRLRKAVLRSTVTAICHVIDYCFRHPRHHCHLHIRLGPYPYKTTYHFAGVHGLGVDQKVYFLVGRNCEQKVGTGIVVARQGEVLLVGAQWPCASLATLRLCYEVSI